MARGAAPYAVPLRARSAATRRPSLAVCSPRKAYVTWARPVVDSQYHRKRGVVCVWPRTVRQEAFDVGHGGVKQLRGAVGHQHHRRGRPVLLQPPQQGQRVLVRFAAALRHGVRDEDHQVRVRHVLDLPHNLMSQAANKNNETQPLTWLVIVTNWLTQRP